MSYVDGFAAAVPQENKQKYIDHALMAAGLFKELGALSVVECWGDDIPEGEHTDFFKAVDCHEGEVVCISWVIWPSKQVRDAAYPKMMEDPRFDQEKHPMPFDGKRMIYGGFDMIVSE
ncbi:conserved hypothetical protein [Vibrio nigripulchritudo MADA3029]|uniref:RNA signal recognition particle 4.5S RNA n=3 Tax=Vibrio nigripulchritudo TaxID=28173 RepID=U4KCB2_9VIBR|nr:MULTISPECIES: DUF1428 domain-containing protein [Vibrio]KJY74713.1 hypothetical protein TW74_18525 [Vibrio nigripulchritudo]UAB73952.1 DUF1428 domain-containing protein [Vibrio sp. SCSIO 43132]CCN33768.1 conserved hypothetical protein [Vibrio nigripulchritudo AM115]CCN41970.1 conserved hypothetical protein [Vibrio nigripulchritudo FTn2]CCN47545.1 conserved hypothetical protein [Vibrio nigripulchritudo MADA3020]